MTAKHKAVSAASGAGAVGFINWICTVPPSQQADMLAEFVKIVPESWKPNVGLITRFLMLGLTIYAAFQASKSGPQSPPNKTPK